MFTCAVRRVARVASAPGCALSRTTPHNLRWSSDKASSSNGEPSAAATESESATDSKDGSGVPVVDFVTFLDGITGGAPKAERSGESILEGDRMNVFPDVDLMKSEGTMDAREVELLDQQRAILEEEYKLTDANIAMNEWKNSNKDRVPTTQDFHGDKFGDLSDPLNRKLFDNDLLSAPDIRKSFSDVQEKGTSGGITLEEGMDRMVQLIKESSATNKLDLYRALPQIACNTKWATSYKEQLIRESMEGVEQPLDVQKKLAKRDKQGKRYIEIIKNHIEMSVTRAEERAEKKKEKLIALIKERQAQDDDLSFETAEAQKQQAIRESHRKRTVARRRGIEKRKKDMALKKAREQKRK